MSDQLRLRRRYREQVRGMGCRVGSPALCGRSSAAHRPLWGRGNGALTV